MKKTAFLFLLPLLATFAPSADAAALAASAFGKTVRLGVPAGAVQEDLEDFPVLVRLSDAAGFSFDDFADPAAELRFATADGENLDYEIDTWDSAQGALVWVSLPVLPAAGTNFTACFAPAPGVALPAVFPTSVWTKAGYLGVWHFSPAADGVYANSAQPSHFATPSAAAAERTDGVVGGCIKPASGTMFVNDSIAWAGDTPHMAVEAWVDRQSGGDQRVFGSQNRDKWSSGMAVRLDGYIYGNAMHSQQNFSVPSTGWQHFTVNFSATEQANALVNGTTELAFRAGGGTGADGDNTHFFHNTAQTNDDHLAVADFHAFSLTSRGTDNGLAFTGLADEFRVRGRNSSTAWMKAVRDSMADVLFLSAGRVLGPAPVLGAVTHVSSAETTAAFAVEVPWIGEGASSAALEALVLPATGPEDWASARRQPLAAFVSPTNATVSVSGFEPETDYRVLFVLSNAVAGYVRASTNGPASFRTAAADPVPSASLAAPRVWATAADLEISVSRFGWGATGLSSLVLRYGTDPSDEASWTAVALDPAAEGVPVSRRLLGLEPGTTYYARAFATNDLPQPRGTATSVVEFTPAVSPVVPSIATTGGNVATTVVGGLSTVVRFLDDGTFELPEETEARLLLVGGGGGGGGDCAPGGGGGGVIDTNGVVLAAGRYLVSVGAGGRFGHTTYIKGWNGGDTVLRRDAGGDPLFTAFGGGGAGAWGSGAGRDGGCGGGGWGNPGKGVPGQGYPATAEQGDSPGGGGGAGGSPVAANIGRGNINTARQADGGPGRASDITGTTEYYGPGGGSGGFDGWGGHGGDSSTLATEGWIWGCGWSHSRCQSDAEMAAAGEKQQGRDGYGGGGGGSSNSHYAGGSGGSGTLVVRIEPLAGGLLDESQPWLETSSAVPAVEALLVPARVRWTGFGSETVRVLYRVAATEEGLASAPDIVAHEALAAGADAPFLATNLPAGERRFVRVFAENAVGVRTESAVLSAVPCEVAMTVTLGGAPRVFDIGIDRVAVFTNSAEALTFETAAGGYVDLLLVGGGGGGGSYVGGGGGGGGFLHLENVYLDPGTYEIEIGAGGNPAPSDQRQGENGGETVLRRAGTGETLFLAPGGGGGGDGWDGSYRSGRAGGSGGGAGIQAGKAGASTAAAPVRGSDGGSNDAAHNGWNVACGGGGAGAPGTHAVYGTGIGGAGGDGLPCSITGEETWYAGGGGAGQNSESVGGNVYAAGSGGRGGGGLGCPTSFDDVRAECRGVDGLGGGGGGGRKDGTDAAGRPRRGAPGGSGTAILRWRAAPEGTVRAEIGSVEGSACSAIVEGTVLAAGPGGASVEMRVVREGESSGEWRTLGSGLADGEDFRLVCGGLMAGIRYDYEIRVRATDGSAAGTATGAAAGSFSTFYIRSAQLDGVPEGATATVVGSDTVYSFSEPGEYFFTVRSAGTARMLMVGGGGAGGSVRGGGGGAGGFIEDTAVSFEKGTYRVVIGAGGEPVVLESSSDQSAGAVGGNGGDTFLFRAGESEPLFAAHGGGGGGAYYGSNAGPGFSGNPGASGGGGGPRNHASGAASTAVAPERGHAGGNGLTGNTGGGDSAAGGGGGADGPGGDGLGTDGDSGANRRQGGAGGAGVSSDITGELRWYAGGGGGGCWSDDNGGYKGLGGSGVGGNGAGWTTEPHLDRTRATAGAAGTGSGGGGGGHFYKQHGCGVADVTGGAGGCGAFLLRTTGANSYRPVAEIERISQVAGSESTVGAAVSLRNAGLSGAASLALVYGPEPDSLVFSASVAEDAGPGVYEAEISGLTPGSTWHFAPVASEGRYVVTGAIRSVTLPAASVPRGEPGLSGLWQTLRSGTSATFRDIFTNAALWAEAGGSNLVAGTIAANSKSTDPVFRDPATDRLYAWVGNWSMFACRGWIYLDGGKTYAFGSRFSDCVRLSIDGRVLVDTYASPVTDAFGTFETDAPGWHEIDARVGRTDVSVWGPDGNDMDSWFHFGLAFNDTGYTLAAPISKWTPLVDPGDGSMLRPEKPAARPVQLVSAAVSGTALSLSGLAGAGGVPARAWAVWGGTDGGVRSPSDWENRRDLGTVAASDAATALSASVPGWGTSAKVARFALETGGVFAWSEPVSFADTAVPSLSAVQVLDASQGDAATFGATLSGGSAPWTVRLWMGADADSLALVASKTLSSAGAFSFALSGLPAGETRWWRIDATDGLGTTVRSDVQSVALPGASRLYDDSDGGDAAWRAVNPYRNRQREIVYGGFLADYGAGETTVRLLRNESSNETFPGAQTTQFHEGEELVVSATGPYELSATLDWDLDVTFNWSVSNSNGRLSWGPTARVRDVKAWCRQLTVVDATDYLRSEAGGLWNDPDSWIPDGVWQDVSGRPRRGSYAAFAAGKASVVAVPDADDDAFPFRFSGFKVGEGADVTVVPAEGASAPALRIKEETYSVPTRPYVLDLGANSTLRFAGESLSVNFYKDGPYSASATNTAIEIADGATVTLGSNTGGTAYNANNKADSRLVVTNGARANVKGSIWLTGIGTRMVVDDATVFQDRNGNDNGYIALCGRGMGGAATLVIRGKAPDLRVGARILANDNSSSDRDQFIDFEVPAEGWSVAPIRSADDNKARKFGQGNSSNRFVVPRIPTNAPAALAGRTMDVPLVRFPLGIHETGVTLSTNNLPHPATDWFYVAADPATGQTNLMAHLVGQSDSGEPQVADVRMTAVAQGTASISFVAIPGKDASGANVPAAVSARVLDASDVPVAGVSVVLSESSVSAPATVEAAVSGLPGGGPFTLRIELSDGVHETATEDFAFYPLGDFGAAGSAAAASVAEDGPFTVWTFTNSAERAVFTVTRAGWARVLAVGGGGSGGGGGWDGWRGGGGGGGGQVLETDLFLVPGDYTVFVGPGGARVERAKFGNNGGTTVLFYGTNELVSACGGGGGGNGGHWHNGSVYYANGNDGANGGGGGGSEEKRDNWNCVSEGGNPTVPGGFPGGSGMVPSPNTNWSSIRAGGGGGGAGGAGGDPGLDEKAWFRGGRGGDGKPSDITGRTVLYGGGGGGGGAGLAYYGGGVGGAGGGGAGRSWEMKGDVERLGSAGADGFGGGGGGGGAAGNGDDGRFAVEDRYSNGSRGGDGVLVVRMRTEPETAGVPRVSVRAAEPSTGGIGLSVGVHSLGGDGAEAQLLFVFDEVADHGAGFARTNALGTVRETGATNFAVHGLKPGTDYVAALVATNAAGGVCEVPVGSFRTSAEFHGDADSGIDKAPEWTGTTWDDSADGFSDNMLRASRGTSAAFISRRAGKVDWKGAWGEPLPATAKLIDALSGEGGMAPGTNQALVFVLDRPHAIREFRFWSYWNDGWSRINVNGIETRAGPNDDWTDIPGSVAPVVPNIGTGQKWTFKATGDDWLARNAAEIRINYRHNGSQGGTIGREIEAFGVPEDEAPGLHDGEGKGRALVAGTAVRTPTLFSVVVSAPAGEPAFTNVVAAWGPVYGGEDTNAWKNVWPLGSMGTGAASLPLSLSDVELGDAAYVRFCGFGEDGSVSWSDSVYVPEIPVRDDLPPVVEFGGLAGSAGASADLSAALLYAGSASPDGTADVVLRLTLDPDGFEEGSGAVIDEFPFATGAAVGTIGPVRIQPLRAARRYYGRFVASNRGGQVSTGEVFSFETSSGTGESTIDWGLRQQKFTQMGGSVDDLRAAVWDESQAEVVEGAIMGYKSGNGDVQSSKTGKIFNWNQGGGWIYKGFVFLEGSVLYTIGGSIDDAIEIKIDGTSVVAVGGNSSSWGSFTPPFTGWFELEIRMGDGGGGYGRDFGIAWNTTGKNAFNDEESNRFIDPGDGSFLRPHADRSLEITAFAVSGSTLSVAARATPGRPNGDLYLVCGPRDLGPDAALEDWGTAGGRTVQVLTGVDGRERTTTATLSAFDADATPVLRLALVPGGTNAIVYSRPVVVDGISPQIGPASATTDGDRMTVSGTVLSAGTGGNFALKVLWGYAEDLSDAEEETVSVSGAGPFSATVPVRPGTNGWWKLVATTSGGGYDATLPEPFETKAGSVLLPAATATVAHHTATVTATLDVLGAGVTTATLWAGADPSNLVEVAGSALVLSKLGKFTLTATFPGLPHEVYWKVVAVNTTAPAGNAEWRSETDVFSLRTFDQGTYTWKPDVAAGDWDDPFNWDVSPADLADAVGYPDSEQAKVRFVAGTEATIAVDREFVFADMSFKYAGLRLTFVGTNAANCTLSGDIPNVASDQNDGTVVSGTRIVLSGITLYDSNGAFNWSTKASADCTLRLENGAVLSMDGWMHVFGTNMWVEAFGGSRLVWRNPTSDGAGFDICGFDGGIRLDDSTMNLPYLVPQRHVKVVGAPQHVVLSGESQLRLNKYFRTWNDSEDYMTNDVLFAFSVPAGGWDSAPLYAEYANSANKGKLGWRDVEPVGKLVFAVDPKSPAFKKGKSFRTQLVSWRAGIDEKSVAYRDSTTRTGFVWARLFFTYGWPSKRTEPLEQGEVPTGVAADIVGQGATFLIFR